MRVGRLSALPFIVGMCGTYAIFFAAVFGNLPSALFGIIWILVVASIMLLIIARLHDAEYNGWWWPLVMFTSLLGLIAVSAVSGTRGPNKYGEQPSGKLHDLLTFVRRG